MIRNSFLNKEKTTVAFMDFPIFEYQENQKTIRSVLVGTKNSYDSSQQNPLGKYLDATVKLQVGKKIMTTVITIIIKKTTR